MQINLTGNQILQHYEKPFYFPELYQSILCTIEKVESEEKRNFSHKDFIKYIEKYSGILNDHLLAFLKEEENSGVYNENELLAKKYRYENVINDFKGGIYEVFCEIFLNIPGHRYHLQQYKSIEEGQDYGVDALGFGKNNSLEEFSVAVQVKYRKNKTEAITWGDVAKTIAQALMNEWITVKQEKNVWIFTSGAGVNMQCLNACKQSKKILVINRDVIESILQKEFSNNFFREYFIPSVRNYFMQEELHPVKTFEEEVFKIK